MTLMLCAYCGEEVPSSEALYNERKNLPYGGLQNFTGQHPGCKYEWDVDKWCKNCHKPICQCATGLEPEGK